MQEAIPASSGASSSSTPLSKEQEGLMAVQQMPEGTAVPWWLHQGRQLITAAPKEQSDPRRAGEPLWERQVVITAPEAAGRVKGSSRPEGKSSCMLGQAGQQGLAAAQHGQLQAR